MKLSIKIMLAVVAAILVVNGVVFYLIYNQYHSLLNQNLTDVARSAYKQVVLVRAWISQYGGVFVPMTGQDILNPYLQDPLLISTGGDTLVKKNPAATRELSEMSPEIGGQFQFHLTSLKLLNPENAPDAFEKKALLALQGGENANLTSFGEYIAIERTGGHSVFRYFAPLYTEESCLACHGQQGYEVGDIRGGISIMFPMDTIDQARKRNYLILLAGGLLSSAIISILIYSFMHSNVIHPLQRLELAAEDIGRGNYNTRIVSDARDEIGDLTRALARMQQEIRRTTNKQIEYEKMYALGELSAGIAHEIRNPLFAIRNNLDYLERHFSQDREQQEIFEEIKYGLLRMSRVINAVLDYAKPHEMEFSSHRVGEVIEHTMAFLKKQLQKEQVHIRTEMAPDLPPVEMDFHRMEQVLVNLITNAKNALDSRPGEIVIGGSAGDNQVEMTVRDNGPGIPEEDLKYIFDPFYTGSKNGTGLGLTIVRRIIEQHHGTIAVSSAPDTGTVFTIRLPITQGSETDVSL